MMGTDGTMRPIALQSEEAAQEEAENEALLEAREREVQCAQQIDLSDEPTAIDLSAEVVVTHERRTTDVAGVGDLLTQPTASQEVAWAAAGEAAWATGTAAAEQPAAAEEPAGSEPPCPPPPAAAAAPCQFQEFSVEDQKFMLAALAQKRHAVEVSQLRELGDKRSEILKELAAEKEKVKVVCLSLALPCQLHWLLPGLMHACVCVCVHVCSIDSGSRGTKERGSARGTT